MDNVAEHIINPREIKSFVDKKLSSPLAEMGLTPSEGLYLKEIGHMDGISLKVLSEQLGVDKALTTRKVSSLIEKGFVKNTSTGHEYSLCLTEKGEAALSCIEKEL